MLIRRINLIEINEIIEKLKTSVFNIKTQYKFIKIQKQIREELIVLKEQTQMIANKYGDTYQKDGYIKIREECLKDCEEQINSINNFEIQLPDIYFSLEELEELGLTLEELSLLDPFIK